MSETMLLDRPAASSANVAASQPLLGFMRTALGHAQLQLPTLVLSPQVTRLLMLFEEPQTIHELRRIIDEPWLPEALIELERRKLIKRIDMKQHLAAMAARKRAEPRKAETDRLAAQRLARQRALARVLFLQQISKLSTQMVERIESCQSEAELQRLAPAFTEMLLPVPSVQAQRFPAP